MNTSAESRLNSAVNEALWASSDTVALASETISVHRASNASRAVDSQQTLVAVPVMITVSIPPISSRWPSRWLEALNESAEAPLDDMPVTRLHIELMPGTRRPAQALSQGVQHIAENCWRQNSMYAGPCTRSVVAVDRSDPPH